MTWLERLNRLNSVYVRQRLEIGEFLGFETRNKYGLSTEQGEEFGFVAERAKGIFGFLLRQLLGHWRSFELHFFDAQRQLQLKAYHPFRWFFQRLELRGAENRFIGAIQRKFGILHKKFVVEDFQGREIMSVASPFFRIWTFPFEKDGREVARIEKKWSGILTEAFTDKDTFRLQIQDSSLSVDERCLLVAAAIYVDLLYFEKKAD